MDEGMRVKEGENTMGNYTREEVLQMAEDEDVEFIRLQFTDMFGTLKNIAITARPMASAAACQTPSQNTDAAKI